MSALDELLAKWRSNPNAMLTVELCSELGGSARFDLVREVGPSAETWHAQDAAVALAVGRMYLDSGMLAEAQTAFVNAGKLEPEDDRIFRFLGETLLRRGDAIRAERVLGRALALEATDPASAVLSGHAKALVSLQKRSGVQAVASEAKRLLSAPSSRKPARPPSKGPTRPAERSQQQRQADAPLPRFQSEDAVEISEIYERETAAGQGTRSSRPAREPSVDDITEIIADGLPSFEDISAVDVSELAAQEERLPSFEEVVNGSPQAPAALPSLKPSLRANAPSPQGRRGDFGAPKPTLSSPAGVRPAPTFSAPPPRGADRAPRAPARAPAAAPMALGRTHEARLHSPAPRLEAASELPHFESPFQSAVAASRAEDAPHPQSALIFEHLARVGVFEPAGGAPPAWEAAPRQRSRGVIPLALACVLLISAGVGAHRYVAKLKAERAEHAVQLNREVEKLLRSSTLGDLRSTDAKLGRSFDLDSHSPQAGRLWLENRILGALLLSEETRGIDSAVYRGRAVGIPEQELAAGRVASFLVEGDLAGAAALLPKWDKESAQDALYQLVAGAVFERAGDARAIERYEAARKLDPKRVVTDVLLARLLLLEYGVERAAPVLEGLGGKQVDPLSIRALSAIAWVVDRERSDTPPEGARFTEAEAKQLPAPLAAAPYMLEAFEAMAQGDQTKAEGALGLAIALSHGPALPATLGYLAIEAGHEALARKAALRALSFAALYPRARTLAARLALAGGRLDEAQKAVEELEPGSPDVAVVRAAIAYETGGVSDLDSALVALGSNRESPTFVALRAAPFVLSGARYPNPKALADFADPTVPWGRPVALDAALDTGNLALAEELLGGETESPVLLFRRARLCRYQKKLDAALTASEKALLGRPTAALLIERAQELIESERAAEARELIARYPALLGPMSSWLGVLIDVASSQTQKAALRLTQLEPPPDEAPTYLRLMVARALVVGADKRARPYLIRLAKQLGRHPDLIATAEALK